MFKNCLLKVHISFVKFIQFCIISSNFDYRDAASNRSVDIYILNDERTYSIFIIKRIYKTAMNETYCMILLKRLYIISINPSLVNRLIIAI